VLAAPLALLCRYLRPADGDAATSAPFDWRHDLAVPAALLAAFVGIRLGVLANFSSTNATLAGYFAAQHYLDTQPATIALGIWEGLRAGWLFVVAAVVLVWPRGRPAIALGAAALATIAVGLATAQDYSRSMSMVIPVGVLGALLVAKSAIRWRPVLLRAGAAAALLLPAHHVMNNLVVQIFYLYHELASFNQPPASAMPELFELRAIHEMEHGDFPHAESNLSLAIKLADDPSSAARQRGILYAATGRWSEAIRDFSTVVERRPQDPDAWFMRARANLAGSNVAAARSDFSHALALAPEGWSDRPDVKHFRAELEQKSGAP